MQRWRLSGVWACLLGLIVVGCTTVNEEETLACPNVRVLKSLGELVQFKPGPGQDLTDIETEAWIERVSGVCLYEDQTFVVDLSVDMSVRRGPANKKAISNIKLIVAVMDAEKTILQREVFRARVPFRSFNTAKYTESIVLYIPAAKGVSGDSFTVFVGYDLSPAELKRNRRKYGQGRVGS